MQTVSANDYSVASTCFGMAPVPVERLQADAASISASLELIESTAMPSKDSNLSVLRGAGLALLDAGLRDQPFWHTAMEMFGHPAPELTTRLSSHLNAFIKCIRQQNENRFKDLVEIFDRDRGFEILDSYVDVAVRGLPIVDEEGVAFIISRPGNLNLQIGVCDTTLRSHVATMMKNQGLSLKGVEVLASWLVDDVEEVKALISDTFSVEAIGNGAYFVKEEKAIQTIEALLKKSGNFVLSPWHIDP